MADFGKVKDENGYIAILQLADLQRMYYRQNDLLGCIFGEITAIAGELTFSTSKNTSKIEQYYIHTFKK